MKRCASNGTMDPVLARVPTSRTEITITEWRHGAIRFDGFWRSRCTVIEAKGHYQQFFDREGQLHAWAARRTPSILDSWLRQSRTQYAHVVALGPPGRLEWHFLEPGCFKAAQKAFDALAAICRYSP